MAKPNEVTSPQRAKASRPKSVTVRDGKANKATQPKATGAQVTTGPTNYKMSTKGVNQSYTNLLFAQGTKTGMGKAARKVDPNVGVRSGGRGR